MRLANYGFYSACSFPLERLRLKAQTISANSAAPHYHAPRLVQRALHACPIRLRPWPCLTAKLPSLLPTLALLFLLCRHIRVPDALFINCEHRVVFVAGPTIAQSSTTITRPNLNVFQHHSPSLGMPGQMCEESGTIDMLAAALSP